MKRENNELFQELSGIIKQGKKQVVSQVNSTLTCVYWQIGYKINVHILENQRAEYGKEIVKEVSQELVDEFGRQFELKNVRRMQQFAKKFPDFQIVVPVARQLTWSHFIILIPIEIEASMLLTHHKKYGVKESYGVK